MQVGKYTYGVENIKVYTWGEGSKITIGNFCSIATGVQIFLGGNHCHKWITTYPFGKIYQSVFPYQTNEHPYSKGDVVIKNDVWISANVTIMSGVTVGNGAVIANNSHVIKDVPDYAIVGGNPAKFIKYRYNLATMLCMNKIEWWNWSEEKINEALPFLCAEPTEYTCDALEIIAKM